jgi:capsular exopolysaccharide synthesis family protein
MSKFFKAIEQAERDLAVRNEAARRTAEAIEPRPRPADVPPDPPNGGARAMPGAGVGRGAPPEPEAPLPAAPRPPARAPRAEPARHVDEHLVTLVTPTSFETEQYRALQYLLEEMHRARGLTLIGVSSPTAADGKSTTAINVAGALARAPGARVLLVDADLRHPSVRRALGMGAGTEPGLVDAILDPRLTLADVSRHLPAFNLTVLPAGHRATARYEALTSPRLGELFAEARRTYDYVLIDTPPLVPLPDCRAIAKWIDGFVIVVAAYKTPRKLVEEALTLMEPAKVVGLVFNGDDRPHWTYGGARSAGRRASRSAR